ncbi:MAG: ABC transporter permease [Gammaproteobacteria bacterium]
MAQVIRQTTAVSVWNFHSLGGRLKPSVVAVAGFFAVVLVFVAVLSIRQGFASVMLNSGSPDVAYVNGNNTPLNNNSLSVIGQAPGVAHGPGGPLVAGVFAATAQITLRSSGTLGSVNMRGVPPNITGVWTDFHIIKGRMFKTGVDEIIVGRQAERLFPGLAIGDTFDWNHHHWKVVGVFEKGGGIRESEIWTDINQLQAAYNATNSYTITYVRLTSPDAFPAFKKWVESNPQLNVTTTREDVSWQQNANGLDGPLALIGGLVTLLMAIGAIFGALNIMYANVASRMQDIATLRALGFARLPILFTVILEGIVLGLVGGVVAAVIAYLVFNGYQASTNTNGAMMAFSFAVTPELIVTALVLALVMGFIGSLFPAIRAARLPVAQALRET